MIILRFKETFRDRSPEWVLAAALLAWGIVTLLSPGLFIDQPFFYPLLRMFTQVEWGVLASLVGTIRLIFLFINGGFRPSAHIRAIGCVIGCLVWGTLWVASISLGWSTPTTAIYAPLLVLDLLSLWFAAGDAKMADIKARNNRGN